MSPSWKGFQFAEYGDPHRLFVQAMMSRKMIPGSEFPALFNLSLRRFEIPELPSVDSKDLTESERNKNKNFNKKCQIAFLQTVDKKLKECGLEIKKVQDEEEEMQGLGSKLMLVNTYDGSNDKTKITIKAMAIYAQFEQEYLKLLVDSIMKNPMRELRRIDAINLCKKVKAKRVSIQEAENILKKFEKNQWLFSAEGSPTIRLSMRFIVEMKPFLMAKYPDQVNICVSCKKVVIRSVDCSDADCRACHHLYCAKKLKSKCNECGKKLPLTREPPLDHDYIDEEEIHQGRSNSEKNKSGGKRRRLPSNIEESD